MIVLDRMLIGGLGFVFDKIAAAVDAEMDDASSIAAELLAAEMRLELGEISTEEHAAIEEELLARLKAVSGGAGAGAGVGGRFEVEGIDTIEGHEDER